MNSTKHFFKKYLLSGISILILFLIVNLLLLLAGFFILIKGSDISDISNFSLTEAAAGLSVISDNQSLPTDDTTVSPDNQTLPTDDTTVSPDNQSISTVKVSMDEDTLTLLRNSYSWEMLLDDDGNVIWHDRLPDNLNHHYSSSEIARFCRWYLDDYPVLVETCDLGLFVVGCPKGSLEKHNLIVTPFATNLAGFGIPILILINLLLIVFLYWRNLRLVEKSTSPILNGIEGIAQGKADIFGETKKGSDKELIEVKEALSTLNKQLHNKEKARAEWINGISHDIRTPLSMILGYSGELTENASLPHDIREQSRIIMNQSIKIKDLISDLNLTSKLEYSMQPLSITRFDYTEMIRQSITEFYNTGLPDSFTISFHTDSEVPSVFLSGDASLLTRMLRNLIQNAITHNPAGCRIEVTLSTEKRKKQTVSILRIADHGIGLSSEKLDALNHPSETEPVYTKNGETAHGFGLRLVRQIVASHHGIVSYEAGIPCGLLVTVTLPIT